MSIMNKQGPSTLTQEEIKRMKAAMDKASEEEISTLIAKLIKEDKDNGTT